MNTFNTAAKSFWIEMRAKVSVLKQLDPNNEIVLGAQQHTYEVGPVALEKDIVRFESEHSIQLPQEFREYLLYFGTYGVGPCYAIRNIFEGKFFGDPSRPLQLRPFEGNHMYDWDEEERIESLDRLDGILQIGTFGNPTDVFLVVSGPIRGEVIAWNYDDFITRYGHFDVWFDNWARLTKQSLENYWRFETAAIGMGIDQVVGIMGGAAYELIYGSSDVFSFNNTPVTFTLDANRKIARISKGFFPIIMVI